MRFLHPRRAAIGAVLASLSIALVSCGRDEPPAPAAEPAKGDPGTLSTLPGGPGAGPDPRLAAEQAGIDPALDGWDTEIVSDRVMALLKDLAHRVEDGRAPDDLAALAEPDYEGDPLRPAELERVHADGEFEVQRPAPGKALEPVRGREGFLASLRALVEPLAGGHGAHLAFKVMRVDLEGERVTVRVVYHATGGAGDRVQQNALWNARFALGTGEAAPTFAGIELVEYEEIRRAETPPLFEDWTEPVLGANASYREQLAPSLDHFARTLDRIFGPKLLGHAGLALGDVDGDGLDDLYVCQLGGLPNLLFLQRPDGTAVDASAASGVDYLDETRSALFADFDGDGHEDLVCAAQGVRFHAGDGKGHFEERALFETDQIMSMAAADWDRDGDLDLYVCRYGDPEDPGPIPYHDANNGFANALLRNDGDWHFQDVVAEVGLDANNRRFSFAAAWSDYDDDGDLDLYVANDFGRNNLYRNDDGRFVDVAGEAGVEDISAGMSVDWGDYNGDGRPDIYVSNMFSSAGGRIAFQRRFQEDAPESAREAFQRHARGNSLFENMGDGTFRDVSTEQGVTIARWAWGSKFVDLNNDGRQDLVVANGLVTNEDSHDL